MTRPPWVLHSELQDPVPADDDDGAVVVRGLLVLARHAPAGLRPGLLVDGSRVRASWRVPSPTAKDAYPEASNAGHARFRSSGVAPLGQVVELVVQHAGERHVLEQAVLPSEPLPRPVAGDVESIHERLEELVATGDRDHAQLRTLRKALAQARPGRSGAPVPAWLEVAVLTDAHFRERAPVAFRRLKRLRRLYAGAGTPERFDAFYALFARAVHPFTLNAHGFKPALASREAGRVWRDLSQLVSGLAGLGYRSFLDSGTLLGVVRDGGLIGHDDDVDLAVLLDGDEPAAAAAEWLALRGRLEDAGLLGEAFDAVHCKLRLAGEASVDLFPAWIDAAGAAYVYPHTFGEVGRDAVLPLGQRVVEGVTLPVPRDPERLLEVNYGPGWRVPDPTFAFSWSTGARRFQSFRSAYWLLTGDAARGLDELDDAAGADADEDDEEDDDDPGETPGADAGSPSRP